MDTQPTPTPETPDDRETSEGDGSPGFWKRMFGGKAEGDSASEEAPAAPAVERNKPRKRTKTIFDRAEVEQKKRYAKAAGARRDKLAIAIGERVEGVLAEHRDVGERRLTQVSSAFEEMNVLLGGIGRNLDLQDQRAERMAQTLESLPKAAEAERIVLESIADKLDEHGEAMEAVPEVAAMVKHGSKMAEERLFALKSLKDELELQREQREQVLCVLRESANRFDEKMSSLENHIVASQVEARTDATRLREAIERIGEDSKEEAMREQQRSAHLVDSLSDVSRRIAEGNVLASTTAAQQDRALSTFQDSQEKLLDQFVRSQNHTIGEMHRLEDEAREREEALARQNRMTLVGSAGFLAILAMAFFTGRQAPPSTSPVYIPIRSAQVAPVKPVAVKGESKTLPAGMKRVETPEGDKK